MLLSDFAKNGTTMQGKAGVSSINANDLLSINSAGQLYPVSVAEYAGVSAAAGVVVSPTTASNYTFGYQTRKNIAINAADASIYMATSGPSGLGFFTVYKYSARGLSPISVQLDTTSGAPYSPVIVQLTNGNFVVAWSGNPSIYFAILDPNLNILVGKTTVDPAGSSFLTLDMIALSAGGFAITFGKAMQMALAIYTNTGAVTYAAAAITSSPTNNTGASPRLTQLSNGNIAIAMNFVSTTGNFYHAISTVTGATVLAATALGSAAANSTYSGFPEIAMMNGYYCVATAEGVNLNAVAYVFNNAGVLQGVRYTDALSDTLSPTAAIKLVTDGTGFIFINFTNTTSGVLKLTYMPVTGTGYRTTTIVGNGYMDAAYDRGIVYIYTGVTLAAYQISATSPALLLASGTPEVAGLLVRPVGDNCVLTANFGAKSEFAIRKMFSSSIVGVAQNSVAAGNPGATVNYAMGPGGYTCNPIGGSVGVWFDHSIPSVSYPVANKGVMLGTSVSLKGI